MSVHPVHQLPRCREVDYRIKGYRPPRSQITPELSDRNLLFHNFEWLASMMAELARRARTQSWLDDPAATREARINWLVERLRVDEALRTVTIASPAVPSAERRRRQAHSATVD